jgi:hypothetical protein
MNSLNCNLLPPMAFVVSAFLASKWSVIAN